MNYSNARTTKEKYLIIGNWKNQVSSGADARKIFQGVSKCAISLRHVETVICPPMMYVAELGNMVTSRNCVIGTQGTPTLSQTVRTGSISPEMIFRSRARYVIIGHSEERAHGVTNDEITAALSLIVQHPLSPVLCIGEIKRDTGHKYYRLISEQIMAAVGHLSHADLARVVIAYEPVWAIGANAQPCSPDECAIMVRFIRKTILDMTDNEHLAMNIKILYGGSVDADNAKNYLTTGEANGLLVGRASLHATTFNKILKIADTL